MTISVGSIIDMVADTFDLTASELKNKRRDAATVLARQVAMYVIRQETDFSLAEVGKELGGRSPATITYGYVKIATLLPKSPSLREKVAVIQQKIYSPKQSSQTLSERELEVLRLVAQGYQNSMIAGRLHTAPDTVKTQVRSIFLKLGASNRANAVFLAKERAIL